MGFLNAEGALQITLSEMQAAMQKGGPTCPSPLLPALLPLPVPRASVGVPGAAG